MSPVEPVRAVLWDADGVLQTGPDKVDRLLTVDLPEDVGRALVAALWDEGWMEAVAGRFDMVEHTERTIREHGLDPHRDALLATWDQIEPLPASRDLVAGVRRGGTPCYLATNQDTLRMGVMRRLLGYDDLMDGDFYSCDVGAAKPDPAYFVRVAERLALPPADLLFVDDVAENVESARSVGLRAEQWHHTEGVAALSERIAGHLPP